MLGSEVTSPSSSSPMPQSQSSCLHGRKIKHMNEGMWGGSLKGALGGGMRGEEVGRWKEKGEKVREKGRCKRDEQERESEMTEQT